MSQVPNSNHILSLQEYESELDRILSRFTRSDSGIWINSDDKPRYDQIVIELRDYYYDLFGDNNYGTMTVNAYQEGISNMYESPSLNSVQRVRSVVSSVIKRIERNPEILEKIETKPSENVPVLQYPEKLTLKWLITHVPMTMWLTFAGVIIASFGLGVTATLKLSIVQDWLGITIQ